MSLTRYTLWGIWKYDNHVFDYLNFPEGIDIDTFRDTLLDTRGDLYLYHQSGPVKLRSEIRVWCNSRFDAWEKMINALNAEYNPLHNYDRHESITDSESQTVSSNATSEVENTSDTENKVSAFNVSTYSNDSKVDNSNTSSASSRAGGTTEDTKSHEGHLYGNIGVTTSQQMIQAELELRRYDLYEELCREFEKRFLIQVY